MVLREAIFVITREGVHPPAFPDCSFIKQLHLSLSVSPALHVLSFFFSSLVTQMETHTWGLRLHCGQENEDHTGAMNCSTVPLPLLLLLGHGNLTNNGKDRRDGGHVEEGRKQRTGNHVLKETEKKWTRRLWSTCRNSGMKTWRAAMQLKVRVNWKPVCCRWKAFNKIPEKHTHTRAHALSDAVTSLPIQLVITFSREHLPTYSASSSCDQFASFCDCS